uniref:solute carrier organic anion transporter family member 4A1-like n=1 Tax=Styela clava TaxID=7725 RepID=UPI00193A4FC4|nr:solute carrier organic anion transporter family member 4A1-like [Styela clava]
MSNSEGDTASSKLVQPEKQTETIIQQNETEPEKQISNKDELCGCDIICCKNNSRINCRSFQPFAKAKWALFFICIANMFQQTITNGLYGVSISTLEKRFELRSTESGMIGSVNDAAQVLTSIVISLFNENVNKPRYIGWGQFIAGIGGIMFALPHFIAPEYSLVNTEVFNYCNNVTEPDCSESILRNYRFFFMTSIALIGIGICPLYTHGIAYLDENVEKKNSALFSSIYFAIGGLGPALGFLVGGAAMELYTDIGKSSDEIPIDSSSYLWVGAWWIGFLICGIFLVLNSVPLLMLPKHLPGTEKFRENRNLETQKSHLEQTGEGTRGTVRGINEIILLLRNKPYMFMTCGLTMNVALIYGFNTFGAKYLESVFGLTPFHSSLLYGVAAIFASFGAQVTSGFIIKKYELTVPQILKFIIVTGILSALCSIGFVVHCGDIDFAGGTVPYPNSTFELSPYSSCNEDCGCSTDRYQPVCGEGIAYFSPCFAGCQTQINDTTFTDCTCVANYNYTSTSGTILSTENCDRNPCSMIIPFAFIVFFCFFTSVLTLSPTLQVTIRCVPFHNRVLAISMQAAISRLFGVIPGRILVGAVLDLACVSWSTECGDSGACQAYKRKDVSRNNTILLLSQTVICAVFYVLVLLTYKPVGGAKGDKHENGTLDAKEDVNKTTSTDDNNDPQTAATVQLLEEENSKKES